MKEQVYETLRKVNHTIMDYGGQDMLADGILESMEIMDIVVALEERFEMEIPPQCIVPEYFQTRDAIVRLVEDSLKEQES